MSTVFIEKDTRAEADAVARIWRIQFGDTHDIDVREMGNKWRVTRTPKATAMATSVGPKARPIRIWSNDTAHPAATETNLRPLLDLIGEAETNDHYNAIFGDENNTDPNLLAMTVDDVIKLQLKILQGGSPSSACGRYQILRGALKDLKKLLDLDGGEAFDEHGQDRLAIGLMQRRGLDAYLVGAISRDRFIDGLAMEWAALPNMTGKSHYDSDGLNSARVALSSLKNAVESIKT